MGYRSTVIYGTPLKNKEALLEVIGDNIKYAETQEHKGYFVVVEEDVKWYDSYDEVAAVSEFIEADDDNFMFGLGEDGAPHSEHGEYYRFVDYNYSLEVGGWE